MKRRIALIATGLFIVATAPLGGGSKTGDDDKAPPAKTVFADLRIEIDRVTTYSDKFVALDKTIGPVFAQMPKQVDVLVKANEQLSMPKDYLFALNSNVEVFRKINAFEPAIKDVRTLRDICEDLESKVLSADPKIKEGNPYLVKVVVNTHDKVQKPVQGLEVVYVQKGFFDDAKRHRKFLKLSTPTDREFIPGNWVVWTTKEKTKGAEKHLPVRPQNGKRELDVDIAAP